MQGCQNRNLTGNTFLPYSFTYSGLEDLISVYLRKFIEGKVKSLSNVASILMMAVVFP